MKNVPAIAPAENPTEMIVAVNAPTEAQYIPSRTRMPSRGRFIPHHLSVASASDRSVATTNEIAIVISAARTFSRSAPAVTPPSAARPPRTRAFATTCFHGRLRLRTIEPLTAPDFASEQKGKEAWAA